LQTAAAPPVVEEGALVRVVSRRWLRNLLNHSRLQTAAAPPVVEEGALAPVSKLPQPEAGIEPSSGANML
jgi:hypothetical protein